MGNMLFFRVSDCPLRPTIVHVRLLSNKTKWTELLARCIWWLWDNLLWFSIHTYFIETLLMSIHKVWRKTAFEHLQNVRVHIILYVFAQSHPDICFSLKHSIVSYDSVCGQQRSWPDCADAQSGQGLRCPHMPEDTFSHEAALMFL